jgi:hypothetical protein
LFTWRKQLGQCATGLLTLLSLFKSALSYDCDFEALVVLGGLAVLGVPFEEWNLTFRADKYGSNSNRIMQRGASGNTEGVTKMLVARAHAIVCVDLRICLSKEVEELNKHDAESCLSGTCPLSIGAIQKHLPHLRCS